VKGEVRLIQASQTIALCDEILPSFLHVRFGLGDASLCQQPIYGDADLVHRGVEIEGLEGRVRLARREGQRLWQELFCGSQGRVETPHDFLPGPIPQQ